MKRAASLSFDFGRGIAMALAILWGLVGSLPFALTIALQLPAVRAHMATLAKQTLHKEAGVSAEFDLTVSLLPPTIVASAVTLRVPGGPHVSVETLRIVPNLLALFRETLQLELIEAIGLRSNLQIENGKVLGIDLKSDDATPDAPFPVRKISLIDASLSAEGPDWLAAVFGADADIVHRDGGFAVEVDASSGRLMRRRVDGSGNVFFDEDNLCAVGLTLSSQGQHVAIHRFDARVSVDLDAAPGTLPSCDLPTDDWRVGSINLSSVELDWRSASVPAFAGRVEASLPVSIAHRFADVPALAGRVGLQGRVLLKPSARFPTLDGRVSLTDPSVHGKRIVRSLQASIGMTEAGVIEARDINAAAAGGTLHIEHASIDPFVKGGAVEATQIQIDTLQFEELMADLGFHPTPHVHWALESVHFDRFGGSLWPLSLRGAIRVSTSGFQLFDAPAIAPHKQELFHTLPAAIRGDFDVLEDALHLNNFQIDVGTSTVKASVLLGYNSQFGFDIPEATIVLDELGPVGGVQLGGTAKLAANATGIMGEPQITGEAQIVDFRVAGFPVGDIENAKLRFQLLEIAADSLQIRKGASLAKVTDLAIDFDGPHGLLLTAMADTETAPHFNVRDLLDTFHMNDAPQFEGIDALIDGRFSARYALNGPQDPCGGGALLATSDNLRLHDIRVFGEAFTRAEGPVTVDWQRIDVGLRGMRVSVPHAIFSRQRGNVNVNGDLNLGGILLGRVSGTGLALERFDGLGPLRDVVTGTLTGNATVAGDVLSPSIEGNIHIDDTKILGTPYGDSDVAITVTPTTQATTPVVALCAMKPPPVNDAQAALGDVSVRGQLLGGTIPQLGVVRRAGRVPSYSGNIVAHQLDWTPLATTLGLNATRPALASFSFAMENLAPGSPASRALLRITSATAHLGEAPLSIGASAVTLVGDTATVERARLTIGTTERVQLVVDGAATALFTSPTLALNLNAPLFPIADFPRPSGVQSWEGSVDASLRVTGPMHRPQAEGLFRWRNGIAVLTDPPVTIREIELGLRLAQGTLTVEHGEAEIGGGRAQLRGRVLLDGARPQRGELHLAAKQVDFSVVQGLRVNANSDLHLTLSDEALPELTGNVVVHSLDYTRNVSLGSGSDASSEGASTDDASAALSINVDVLASRPLSFKNKLADLELVLPPSGLTIAGPNTELGAQGAFDVTPRSTIRFQGHSFSVVHGSIRFESDGGLTPEVDITAQTEYRRYASQVSSTSAVDAASQSSGAWRITMHAHGTPDSLAIDLSSDPPLSQDDVLLLLSVGMTRAELDRSLASSLGVTLGVEAINQLTGADEAVKNLLPLVDEIRFGTAYSARTGRPQPVMTMTKRLSERAKATVTSGLTDDREVRSGIEWEWTPQFSVIGSYDNVNDESSSQFGNLGMDVRWHLEFE